MHKPGKFIKLFLFLFCLEAVFLFNNLYAQQLPDQLEDPIDQTSESFNNQDNETITIASDDDTVHLESMASAEQLAATYAYAFDMLNVQGAQEITEVYLENGFAVTDVAKILKNAEFTLEDTFKGIINYVGEDGTQEVIGALLEAKFNSSDVFKIAINHIKQTKPELTDNQIIESILGTTVDSVNLKVLMQEIFVDKVSSVSDAVKSDLVLSMIDSGFSLNEITTSLSDNGFNIDQIAQIYSLGSIDIGLTYDLLLNTQGSDESIVTIALLNSAYSKTDVFECIVDKLLGPHTTGEIAVIAMGPVSEEGVSTEQLSNSIVLGAVLLEQVDSTEICQAFISAGFNLENNATLLNGIGVDLESAFSALLSANGGQGVGDIAKAMISNGFDIHTVFSLSAAELNNQSVDPEEIVNLLIGKMDIAKPLTKTKKDECVLLLDVLINLDVSLSNIAAAFTANDFSLTDTAKIFKTNSFDEQTTYSALTTASNNDYSSVAIAMTEASFTTSTVITLTVADLKNIDTSDSDIMSMLIQAVAEEKKPLANQTNIAISLTKILGEQGTTLSDIGTNLINLGFETNDLAKVFKRAEIDLNDAFVVMVDLNTEGLAVLCSSLRSAGYKAADIFIKAVTTLQDQDQNTTEIITSIISETAPDGKVSGSNIANARDLVNLLISQGSELQDIYQGLLSVNFSLTDIGKVMQRTTVELDVVFADMLGLEGGQDIKDVTEGLISGGYNRNDVFQLAIGILKDMDVSTAGIVNTLIGIVIDQEKGPTSYQNSNGLTLFKALADDGAEVLDICTGFIDSGFSLNKTAIIMGKAEIELMPAYKALLDASGGQSLISVVNALNESGYSIAKVYLAVVPDLQTENSVEQIISLLIGDIVNNGISDPQIENMYTLVYVLSETGVSIENICSAMHSVGATAADTAKIIYRKVGNVTEAYNLLTTNYGQENLSDVAIGMIDAGYSMGTVLNIVVPDYQQMDVEMPEIISLLLTGNPQEQQLELSAKLMNIFISQDKSVASISQSLFDAGIDMTDISGILKTNNTEFSEAYTILTGISPGQNSIDISFAMIDGGFDSQLVINTVVDDLKELGNDNTQIISMFLGTVDPDIGLTPGKEVCAVALIVRLYAGGDSMESICADLGATGLNIERILPLMSSAEINVENAFNGLLNFVGGQEPVELAKTMITNKYNSGDVLSALVDHLQSLGSQYDVNTIFAVVIGDIDEEEGITDTQLGYARVLSGVFMEKGIAIEAIASAILNHGLSLDNTAVILKQAGAETEKTYTALLAVYTPEENQVATQQVTAKMIAAGYDSFSLYSFAVETLSDQGINNESDIVNLLIGPVNSEDKQQLSNAGKLSLVIGFNKAKLTAQNTADSFISLFKQGFSISEIAMMLDEGGVSQEQIDATLNQNLNGIVKELSKAGITVNNIVKLLVTQDNKAELIRPMAEQLRRNDFGSSSVRNAFFGMPGGMHATDWPIINQGIADADDYSLENTEDAATMSAMIVSGQTLTEISQYFAEQGYQMSYVTKLFKTQNQSIDDIFVALENTKTAYSSELLGNDTAAPIALLKFYDHREVFTCAAQYYKQAGISPEQIILKLMSSEIKADSTNVIADTLIGEYYKSKADIQPESFVMLIKVGYSVTWIKSALLENNTSSENIEAFIQDSDNFKAIYQGLRDNGMSQTTIVKRFDIEENPGEYTVLLAENMIQDDMDDNEVRNLLLKFNADPSLIKQGIDRGKL